MTVLTPEGLEGAGVLPATLAPEGIAMEGLAMMGATVPEGLEPEGLTPAAAVPVELRFAVVFGFRAAFAALFFIFMFGSFRSGGA